MSPTWGDREYELLRGAIREMRAEIRDWQRRHEDQHQADARSALTGHRWVVSTCIAAMVLLVALIALVLQMLGRTHG